MDPNADAGDMLQSNTRGLMAAMSTLPELTERKRTIDKHTALLGCIMKVGLPAFHPGVIHSAGDRLQRNARGLMAAVSTLPTLTQRKRTIDKHTALLGFIMNMGPQPSPPRRRCALHWNLMWAHSHMAFDNFQSQEYTEEMYQGNAYTVQGGGPSC